MARNTDRPGRWVRALTGTAAAGLLLTGCGAGDGAATPEASAATAGSRSSSPKPVVTGNAVHTLRVRQVRAVVPDGAVMPGWKNISKPVIFRDGSLCEGVIPDVCDLLIASGQSSFSRGRETPQEGVHVMFSVWSCTTKRGAREFYAALDTRGADGTKLGLLGSLGDERLATHHTSGRATLLDAKLRSGTTVLWINVMGSERTATTARLKEATQLLYDRTLQAKGGFKPATIGSIA
ncbi:hypothetical protein ACIO93_38170 [Streptomyces sp. NPDC087903]|uniref:hypothetical protein n=1 Tax=Streptomyces sp. NPDC087903 TaxID=3365819 RepID=UPI0038014140